MNIFGVRRLKELHQPWMDLVNDVKIKLDVVYLLTSVALEIMFLSLIIAHLSGND